MKVKTFDAHGGVVSSMEKEINSWLQENPHINIRDTQTAACTITSSPDEEFWQYVVISIWYEEL